MPRRQSQLYPYGVVISHPTERRGGPANETDVQAASAFGTSAYLTIVACGHTPEASAAIHTGDTIRFQAVVHLDGDLAALDLSDAIREHACGHAAIRVLPVEHADA